MPLRSGNSVSAVHLVGPRVEHVQDRAGCHRLKATVGEFMQRLTGTLTALLTGSRVGDDV